MSGGFGFGMQNTTANTGTFSFGSNPTATSTGISFGTPAATGTASGFQFSSPGQATGGLSFGTPQTTTAASSAGGSFTFGKSSQPQPGGLSFGTPQQGAVSFMPTGTGLASGQQTAPLSFGSSAPQTTLSFGSATPQTTLSFGSTTPQTALSFGSTVPQTTLSFGSTVPQTTLSFGSNTPQLSLGSTVPQTTLSFGSTIPQTTLSFGSTTPQTTGLSFATPQTTVPAFGSTPQIAGVPAFSSTPQTAAAAITTAAPLTFSSMPQTTITFAPSGPSLYTFGSSTPRVGLGSAAQAKPTALAFATPFTTTSTTTTAGLSFVTTTQTTPSTTTAPTSNLFTTSIQPITQATTSGFSLGTAAAAAAVAPTPVPAVTTTTAATAASVTTTPVTSKVGTAAVPATYFSGQNKDAAAKPSFSFGVPSGAPTVTTAAVTATTATSAAPATGLFSFPTTPKTTATTTTTAGFTLPAGGGSLFSSFSVAAATTSAAATTTTTTTTPFKGLGGVDTATSLPGIIGGTTGRSDIKSVKDNHVPNEIMQTIDTFKTFVKQQKNLACEVTRTSGKPMNKVTEDVDSLKQILTTVHSALQKNRQMSNKLKADTTKCLLLCEMAQHTHDTPVGLQNENVAPLEYFLQLATKFEKDVANLRTEIDNTEKHVNSLSQPAVLTSQELSVALRRLHDSFVALAGQLQTAHATVAIQKERHLNLRRHFLKDGTNIFEPDDNKSLSYMKSFKMPVTLSAGPTPFSSMGGTHSISMLTSQDKSGPTFPATSTSLSGWGTPSAQTGTSLLQSTGSTSLFSPQPVENQNFQLLKPPPGNKRGKR